MLLRSYLLPAEEGRGYEDGMKCSFAAAVVLLVGCNRTPAPGTAPSSATAPSAAPASAAAAEHVDGAAAKKLVQGGARLVDVRTPEEYAAGHIEGAVNVPVDTVEAHDLGEKDQPIVVYCASGRRSARAAAALRAKGFVKLYDLGPMSAWSE